MSRLVINDRIADLIAELKLNPNSFADAIGVSGTVVHNIVKGRRNKPSFDLLLKIFTVYTRLNTAWLLKGEGDIWVEPDTGQVTDRKKKETKVEPLFDLEPRITILVQELTNEYDNDPRFVELAELVNVLINENNYRRAKIIKLFEKNEKVMDVLRGKLGLEI